MRKLMNPHHSTNATADPEPVGEIDCAAFDRAFRAWQRRRACPDELEALDRRDAATRERATRRKGRK